jgi:hypothetical protein
MQMHRRGTRLLRLKGSIGNLLRGNREVGMGLVVLVFTCDRTGEDNFLLIVMDRQLLCFFDNTTKRQALACLLNPDVFNTAV